MKVTITIPKGYMGQCFCGNDATREVWSAFDDPLPAIPALNIPEQTGIWMFICGRSACFRPDMTLKEDRP